MDYKQILTNLLAISLQENFVVKKKGAYFYIANDELFIYINIQKSSLGNRYYINICVRFKDTKEENKYPKLTDSDIVLRVEEIVPQEKNVYNLLNFDNVKDIDERTDLLFGIIRLYIIPFIMDFNTTEKIRVKCMENIRIRSHLNGRAQKKLRLFN